ncbi:hypothetical protein Tco_0395137, partial [Tanacetum coccineum]
MIRLRHGKTPYELMHSATQRMIKLGQVTTEGRYSSSGPALHEMAPATISSGLMPNPHPSTPFVLPS